MASGIEQLARAEPDDGFDRPVDGLCQAKRNIRDYEIRVELPQSAAAARLQLPKQAQQISLFLQLQASPHVIDEIPSVRNDGA
jgi:hypothetical protein